MPKSEFRSNFGEKFQLYFLTIPFFGEFVSLGFGEFNPKEKEETCLTRSVFYGTELMRKQMFKQEFEFERECVT
jgi:hypothetical protein